MSDNNKQLSDPEVRASGLGSSDMPVVLGVSPFSSPYELWLQKTGRAPLFAGNEATALGTEVESVVVRRFESELGKRTRRVLTTPRHAHHTWAFAHPDRRVVGESSLCEVKTTINSDEWGEPFTDEVPTHVLPQVHHQMWVTDVQLCYVAVWFMHRWKVSYYRVERDKEWDALLAGAGQTFWEMVQQDREPPIDFAAAGVAQAIRKAYGVTDAKVVTLSPEAQRLHETASMLDERAKAYGKAVDALRAELMHEMRDAWVGLLPDGSCYRRQVVKRKGYTVDPSEAIDFRHMKNPPKGARG